VVVVPPPLPPPVVVVVVAGGFLVVVVVGGFLVVVVVAPPDDAVLTIGVAPTDVDDAFTTYHLPPAKAAPSPWDCFGPESPANVYSGYELNVTCLEVALRATKPIFPLTFAPRLTEVTELLTVTGIQWPRQPPVHLSFAPFSTVKM
jgi:hypothetical protein